MSQTLTELTYYRDGHRHTTTTIFHDSARILLPPNGVGLATIHDEDYLDKTNWDWMGAIEAIKGHALGFRFPEYLVSQDQEISHAYHASNRSRLNLSDYAHWEKKQIKKDVREGLRRANREGVSVERVAYSNLVVEVASEVFNETPYRQGRRFWHYGKSHEQLRQELAPLSAVSQYFLARKGSEYVGFAQIVPLPHRGSARSVHVISKAQHVRSRVSSALIQSIVAYCCDTKLTSFVYGRHIYSGNENSNLRKFKERHGFRNYEYKNYYVPVAPLGHAYLAMGLYQGLREMVPKPAIEFAKSIRGRLRPA